MDHLPWRYTDRPRPVVPNFCGHLREADLCPNYESFFRWPHFQQWSTVDTSFSSKVSLCQSWLFLGLAKAVACLHRISTPIFDLVQTEDPNVLDTCKLAKTFLHLRWNVEQRNDVHLMVNLAQRQMVILSKYAEEEKTRLNGRNAWTEDTFNIFWSAALFHELLGNEVGDNYEYDDGVEVAEYINSQTFILDRVRLGGRCATALRRKRLSLLDTWPLLSIPLPKSLEVDQALLHDTCTGRDCKAFHINRDNYQMQHAVSCKPGHHCISRGIAAEALKTRIEGGLFPVVRSAIDHTGLHIDIVDGDDLKEFTAISHVWAGGLGNFEDNAVYECQLERLHLALSPSKILRSTVYYWLDTLCIPVNDEAARKKAIDDMARIYASAHSVYVLDPIMQHLDVSSLTYKEQAVLIAASPWMARSWTFQEAALAVRLKFQFRDAVIGFSEVALPDSPLASSQLQALWHRDVDRLKGGTFSRSVSTKFYLANIYALLDRARLIPFRPRSHHKILQMAKGTPMAKSYTPERSLQLVWQELSQRSSKELDDVAAIIAVFIGRSAKEILDIEPKDRIHALLWSLESLPVPLLFAPTMDNSTDSWCPMLPTCITDSNDYLPSVSYLKFTEDGLLELNDNGKELFIIHDIAPFRSKSTKTFQVQLFYKGCFIGHLQIVFPEPNPRRCEDLSKAKHGIILILHMPVYIFERHIGSSRSHPGICVQLKSGDGRSGSRHAAYSGSFRWTFKRLALQESEFSSITLKLNKDNSFSSPSDAMEALEQSGPSAKGKARATQPEWRGNQQEFSPIIPRLDHDDSLLSQADIVEALEQPGSSAKGKARATQLARHRTSQELSHLIPRLDEDDSFLSRADNVEALGQPGSSTRGEIASSLRLTENGITYSILLDMNIGDRKQLEWSRRAYYAFQSHSEETAKPLTVLEGSKVTFVFCCIFRLFVLFPGKVVILLISGETSSAISSFAQIVPAAAILFPLAVLRVILGGLEEPYLRTVFRAPLQRRWASSFKVTGNGNGGNATPMAQYPSIRNIWPLISIYFFFSVLALTLLPPQIRFFSHRWGKHSVQDEFDGSLAGAFLIRSFETMIGCAWDIDKGQIRFDLMLAITLPYLWMCIELILRNTYVLWLCAQNFNRSRNAEIAFTEDHPNDDQRDQWFSIIIFGITSAVFIGVGFSLIAVCIGQSSAETLGNFRFVVIAEGPILLLVGCWIAVGVYEDAFRRKCWLELKIIMVARGLQRLWSRN